MIKILGIDLVSIAPIPGVLTFCEDITTAKCRTTLKRELKTWKADVYAINYLVIENG
jgi:AdoMet-dependent rRNA methyltransferase SPB1